MSQTSEPTRMRKISQASTVLPPIPSSNSHRRFSERLPPKTDNWTSSDKRRHSEWPTGSHIGGDPNRKRSNALWGPPSQTTSSSNFSSPSRIYSDNPPPTVAPFLRPNFKRNYVFGYSLVVSAVMQRYNRFLADDQDLEARYEQNPCEVWLADVPSIHEDKQFMNTKRKQNVAYAEKLTLESASDTFVTQVRQNALRKSRVTPSPKPQHLPPMKHKLSKRPSLKSSPESNASIKS